MTRQDQSPDGWPVFVWIAWREGETERLEPLCRAHRAYVFEHYHVTHNYNDLTTGFDHLSSSHAHEHDHGELTHTHHPHIDFDSEHRGEAHMHDHEAPVKLESLQADTAKAPATAKPRTAKRKTPATRTSS